MLRVLCALALVLVVRGGAPVRPNSTVVVTDYSTMCISLAWSAISGATAYQLWYTRASDGLSEKLYDGPSLYYTMRSPVANETYVFFYKAGNAFGVSAASDPSSSVVVPSSKRWQLYVSDHSSHRVLRFHADGQFNRDFIRSGAGGLARPWGVEQGPGSDVYVSSEGTNSVLQYEQCSGEFVGMLTYVPGQPRGLSFHASPDSSEQSLYVASHFWDKILRFNATTGSALGTFASARSPWGIKWQTLPGASASDMLVSSEGESTVFRFEGSSGKFLSKYIDKQVGYASGLDLTDDGSKLYVTGPYAGNLIATFDTSSSIGRFSALYEDKYMKRCQGLVYHQAHLYVACKDQIRQYDAETGEFVKVFAELPGMSATFLRWLYE